MKYIGRYEVDRKLGQGAMGVVFLARDPKLGRQVAIKTFDVGDSPNEDEWHWLRERLLAEGSRAGSLDHPNIVKVFDVVDEGDLAYIVMEYVSGITLDETLRRHGTLPQDTVLRLLRQSADGLDYAHSRGIIHRDIKPGNLMIDDDGNVKVTDFGIAKRAGAATQTGRLMGTPEFMAPEQIEAASEVDGRADQFALATLAYLLLTGQKAFDAETLGSLSHQIVTKEPTAPSRVNPQLSPAVDSVFRKAMAKTPGGRYGSCLEFIEDLERSLFAPVDNQRPLIPALIVALVAITLAGVAYYIYSRPRPVPAPQVTLTADASEVDQDGQTTLHWASQNAERLEIAPTIGAVGASGSRLVQLGATTTFQATAFGAKEQRTAAWTVRVRPTRGPEPPPPPPPPPPPVRTAHFSLTVLARGLPVPRVFNEDDQKFGDLGMKELAIRVDSSAAVGRVSLRMVWYKNGDEMEDDSVTPADLGRDMAYRNKPVPGKYRVKLFNGREVVAETSFEYQRGQG